MSKTIRKVYKISSQTDDVWQALVDPVMIDKWSGSSNKMSSEVGRDFELWDGDIFGKNLEVIPGKKLVQEWYGGNWPEPSKVTFTIKKDQKGTILELVQINVPDEEFEDIERGWDEYYLGPIKEMLENSS